MRNHNKNERDHTKKIDAKANLFLTRKEYFRVLRCISVWVAIFVPLVIFVVINSYLETITEPKTKDVCAREI